jgi:hypothetical protein
VIKVFSPAHGNLRSDSDAARTCSRDTKFLSRAGENICTDWMAFLSRGGGHATQDLAFLET